MQPEDGALDFPGNYGFRLVVLAGYATISAKLGRGEVDWPADKQGAGREGAPTGGAATSSSVRSNVLLLLRPNNLTLPDQREMGKINTNTNCLSGRTTAAKKEKKKKYNTTQLGA